MPVTDADFDALAERVAAIEAHLGIGSDPEPPATWTVRPGDTLSGVAAATGLTVAQLADWNALPDPDVLAVGQVLRLTAPQPEPDPDPDSDPEPEPEPGAPQPPTGLAAVVNADRTVLLTWDAPASTAS